MNTSTLALKQHFAPNNTQRRVTPIRHTPAKLRDVASAEFIHTMRGVATGVNIVTTDGPAGRFGLTVSAFSSVSAEPPMVLVCINRSSPACAAVRRNRRFCVNVLSRRQSALADTFSGRPAVGEAFEFQSSSWSCSATGSPILREGTASLDCFLETFIDAGTHTIFIGSVKAVESTAASPLIHTNGAYRRMGGKA